jgi:hypothetical protein
MQLNTPSHTIYVKRLLSQNCNFMSRLCRDRAALDRGLPDSSEPIRHYDRVRSVVNDNIFPDLLRG